MSKYASKNEPNSQSTPLQKSFLLLQGVASPFFNELEKALVRQNHNVLKINFCGGDLFTGRFFSEALNSVNYQGDLESLPTFYSEIFEQHKITDIALFGDTRPIHLEAIALAKRQNINIHVFEEGYFRPNYVTLDQGGVNAYSHIYHASNNQADWFLNDEYSQTQTPSLKKTGGNLLIRGWHDIRYHLAKALFSSKFPHYKTHRPDSPLAEYWGFLRRIPAVALFYNSQSNQRIERLLKNKSDYYLLPLQLEADSQMRVHSSFERLEDVIKTTLKSFSQHAHDEAVLVIKLHPLDPWFVDYRRMINDLKHSYNLAAHRIIYLEAGNLDRLLSDCKGTILVNSTVGNTALAVGCPVIALGSATYNISGLTFQGPLDDFWQQAQAPNKPLFEAYRRCYIENTQINGGFYNQQGIKLAVKNAVLKIG